MRRLAAIGHGGEVALAAEDAAEMRLIGEAAGQGDLDEGELGKASCRISRA
jgi:hypothetical protein